MLDLSLILTGLVVILAPIHPEWPEAWVTGATLLAVLIWVALGLRIFASRKKHVKIASMETSINSLEKDLEKEKSAAVAAIASKEVAVQDVSRWQQTAKKWEEAFSCEVRKTQDLEKVIADHDSGKGVRSDAVSFLALLQQKGRFVDFLMGDIDPIPDARIGAAARVIHQGCKRVLNDCFEISPVEATPEGQSIEVESDYDAKAYRLVGEVADQGPYAGRLLHKGWITEKLTLPLAAEPAAKGHVIAPAEIEMAGIPSAGDS